MIKKSHAFGAVAAAACLLTVVAGTPAIAASPMDTPSAPEITGVDRISEARAIVSVDAQPGAVVRTTDADGKLLGIKVAGTSGSVQYPVALNGDGAIDVSQSKSGVTSAESTASVPAFITTDVVATTAHAALVTFRAPRGHGNRLSWIYDEDGNRVAPVNLGFFATAVALDAQAGVTHHYTVRWDEGIYSTVTKFSFTAGNDSLETPIVDGFDGGTTPGTTQVHLRGRPHAALEVQRVGRPVSAGDHRFDADGAFWINAQPGTTYEFTQQVGSDRSETATVEIPTVD